MTTIKDTMDSLLLAASGAPTHVLEKTIRLIGFGHNVSNAQRMVRCAALTVYEERVGEEAADALCCELGLYA